MDLSMWRERASLMPNATSTRGRRTPWMRIGTSTDSETFGSAAKTGAPSSETVSSERNSACPSCKHVSADVHV